MPTVVERTPYAGHAAMLERLAAAPISWGICEVPDWGAQLPPERVLAEMAELGFATTELGAAGYLPEDPSRLKATLAAYDLTLLGGFVPLVLHEPSEADATWAAAEHNAELLAESGGTYFITAAVTTWDWAPRAEISADQWQHLYRMLDELEDFCADRGLVQAIHPHLHTVIERADEVQGVLDNTRAGWTLDTGHLLIGGYSPVEFAKNHADRVRHVHLKDVVLDLARPVFDGEQSIMAGVQAGMFCNLGAGDVALEETINLMLDHGFDGWYVIEQDAAVVGGLPPAGAGPVLDVAASVNFLQGLAFRGTPDRENKPMEGNNEAI